MSSCYTSLILYFERSWRPALFILYPLELLLPVLLLLFESIVLIQKPIIILECLVNCRSFLEVHERLVGHTKRLQLHDGVLTVGGYHFWVDVVSLAYFLCAALFIEESCLVSLVLLAL